MPYGEPYKFYNGTQFSLHDAGHIPGSAQILVEDSGSKLLYTGDMNSEESRLQHAAVAPETDVDALIVESTYSNREHPVRKDVEKDLIEAVEEALQEGNALIPCFAIGRTQEILLVLNAAGIDAQIYVDGMGIASSTVVSEYSSYVKNPSALNSALSQAHYIQDHTQRRKVAESKGKVIVATAGMLDGGPALTYIQKMNQSGKGAVLLTGYQVAGTNGRLLVEKGQLRDRGRTTKINLQVKAFDFSAHSGRSYLLDYIKKVNPKKVYCVHGDEPTCLQFAHELREQEGFEAFAPAAGDSAPV
jgi:putative mRNA 3-end processing factor